MLFLIQSMYDIILNLIFSLQFIIFLFLFIILYQIFIYFIRDRSYIIAFKNSIDPEINSINDLIETPLVTIIVPAWNEGEIFNGCLLEINKLSYPNLKVIVNAGGSDETINIANSFKKYDDFTIIYQKQGEGKIKAINDCLKYISEGIVYLIDADTYLDDEIFFQMLHSIINNKEKVTVSRTKPHRSIQNKDLAKYIYINRNPWFSHQFSIYSKIITQNTILSYEIIDKVSPFSEGILSDDSLVIGLDIRNKGYKIINIKNMVESFNFPLKIKDYYNQNLRWLENALYSEIRIKKGTIMKYILSVFLSIYILISPILFLVNSYLFFIALELLLYKYLKKIRKILFYKSTKKDNSFKFHLKFYLKIIFYIYLELTMNLIVFFELLFYQKAYKKRKNLDKTSDNQ